VSPRLQILVAALLFGTTGTAQALGHAGSPLALGSARIVLGGLLLAGLAALRGELRGFGRRPVEVLLAAAGVAAYQLAFFAAVRSTGVAVGTVVAIGAGAVLTGGFELLLEGTAPGRRWCTATALAVCGVALLASAAGARVAPAGVALALVAAAGYAGYAVLSKRLLRLGRPPVGVMGASFGLAGVLLVPVLALTWSASLTAPRGAAAALYLAVVPTVGAYLFYVAGLRRISAAETTTIGLAEPVTAAFLAVVVLHERLGGAVVAGSLLVLCGLAALTVPVPRVGRRRAALAES
jgi:DME family drug/metabolite transporter